MFDNLITRASSCRRFRSRLVRSETTIRRAVDLAVKRPRKLYATFARKYVERSTRVTSIPLHARRLVLIRADLRSVDGDRSRKTIGHYDTPVINSRPSWTTYTLCVCIYVSCSSPAVRARINREADGKKKKEESASLRGSRWSRGPIYIFGRIYATVYIFARANRRAQRKSQRDRRRHSPIF